MSYSPLLHPVKTCRNGVNTATYLASHPTELRSIGPWVACGLKKVASPSRSVFWKPMPSYTFSAIRWLDSVISERMNVFEYGSGGSTAYFARRVRSLVSVEHEPFWEGRVRDAIPGEVSCAVDYRLVPCEAGTDQDFASARTEYSGRNFRKYVESISEFPDEHFDIVSVDGRCREQCLRYALPKVRAGGYLILDNSERPRYQEVISEISNELPRKDYEGLGPFSVSIWSTSVWSKA